MLGVSKSPKVAFIGTQTSSIKLTTKTKVSNLVLFIHKSKVTLVVMHLFNASNTYYFVVFAKRLGM
jgi:hypothetical protein